jgi:hypothetical protein
MTTYVLAGFREGILGGLFGVGGAEMVARVCVQRAREEGLNVGSRERRH